MPRQVMAQDELAAKGVVRVLRALIDALPNGDPAKALDDQTLHGFALAAAQEYGNDLGEGHLRHLAEGIYLQITTKPE